MTACAAQPGRREPSAARRAESAPALRLQPGIGISPALHRRCCSASANRRGGWSFRGRGV